MRKITLLLLSIFTLSTQAQSYNMIRNSSDTASDCSGTLYDHGGPSGSYYNSSSDNFYILPQGGSSIDITFTSFGTESCCDRVRIYDNVNGTLIGTYGGYSLPNGGAPINVPSGEARILFTSDYSVTGAGFALTWTAGGTANPTASYSPSVSNAALLQPVTFTNTSTGGGTSTWYFGDGDSASTNNPVHAYSSPGNYTITLIQSNCYGADTTTGSISVQAAATVSVSPDTLSGAAPCGGVYRDTLQFNYLSGGAALYDISVRSLTDQNYLTANFESSLSPFVRSTTAPTTFNSNVVLGGAGQGSAYLQLSGYAAMQDGVYANVNASDANYFSFMISVNSSSRSYVQLGDEIGGYYYSLLGLEAYYGNLRIHGDYTYTVALSPSVWHQVEVKNIDYTARTCDVYLDGVLAAGGLSFNYYLANEIDRIDIANYNSSANVAYDAFNLKKIGDVSLVSLSDTLGVTSSTQDIAVEVDLAGAIAGLQQYILEIATNASGADSLIEVPLNVTVTGTPVYSASTACFNFDTAYIGIAQNDSLLIFNQGCDTMDLNSLSTSNSEFSLSQSALNIAPGDSAWLYINYLPANTGLVDDTLFLNGNLDTAICLSAEAFTAPAIAFDSATYTLNSFGCNDSIPFQFYLYNQGSGANLNWTLIGGNSLFDDFENGLDPSIWTTHGSNQIFNGCYEHSGINALSMMGTNRTSETVMLNLFQGDSVGFWAFPGNGGGSGCENPDGGEDMHVQYRLNGASFWTTIGTIYNYNTAAAYYSFAIPVSGQMQVRLYQSSYTSASYDHYRIDDFRIVSSSASSDFSPNTGSTVAGDSILISGYLQVANLYTGSYPRSIRVQSDDPAHPDTLITVNINVYGEPDLWASAACMTYDTLYTGATNMDSVMIVNQGCDDLNLTAYSLGGTQFGHSLSPLTIVPEDTAWLAVSFNPDGTVLGLIRDTLTVSNNDSIWKLCLEGFAQGAPVASLNPDSLSVTVTNCGDSISIPVYLRNSGLSGLDFDYIQGNGSNGKISVGVVGSFVYSTERTNIYNIALSMPEVNLVYVNASSEAQMTQELDTIDVLIVPESSSISMSTTFGPAYRNFVNNGGVIIFGYQAVGYSTAYNIMPISNSWNPGSPIPISMPSHPIAAGLPGTGMSYLSATQRAAFVNTAGLERIIGAVGTDEAVVAAQPYGDGLAIHIGYDFFQTNSDLENVLKNSIIWGASRTGAPGFISASPDSGLVAVGDSVLINININTAGISNGTYDYDLFFQTNDPANNPLRLPLHLVVNGLAKAQVVDSTCISFGSSLQGAAVKDTFEIYNEGCDTLDITSYLANNSDFTISNIPMNVAPGDTAKLEVIFSPFSVGLSTDTLEVSTNDTTVYICVSGIGVGAALPRVEEDTIYYRLQKCKVIGNKQIKVKNLGQGQMNFDIQFGRFSDSSQIAYNVPGASTLHSFSGLPNTADSIKLRIILNGDYDALSERATLYLDGNYWQTLYDNNRFYQLDTIEIFVVGTQVATLLADGMLDVGLYNPSSVDGGAGSFHRVELEVVQTVNWVSVVGANAGTIPANDSVNRNLLFNAALLPLGTHYTTMIVNNNSPSQPKYRKPVKFDVVAEPEMVLSDTCAYFTLTRLGDTTSRTVTIYNDGCMPLVISSMTSTSNQFKIYQSSATIPVGDSLVLDIDFIPTSVSSFSASIFIISNDTNRTICLNGQSGSMPVADFSFNDENICIGEVSFNNSNSQYFNTLYWDFGDGTFSSQNNPTHVFPNPGTYRVILRTTNTLGFDTISKLVTVNPLVVNFGISNDTIQLSDTAFFSDSTPNAVTWIWDFGDGSSSTQQNPSHQYTVQGLYNVKLTVIDNRSCSNTLTKQIRVENKIGLVEWQLENQWSLYPNPNEGRFKLRMEQGDWSGLEIQILDAQGRVLAAQKGGQESELDFDLKLASGVYHLQILKQGSLMDQTRVVIQH
ncbi:PKD domain-containing protein [Croceimicrobium sp.]|uniref:PKD domain-containing protein n=1 Tax=Croceimicrobium sp. TaxID=2828340 RepID=UPI003BACCB45